MAILARHKGVGPDNNYWWLGFYFDALNLKSKWEQAWTGKEKHFVVDRWPPASAATTTQKVQAISTALLLSLDEEQQKKLNALIFIDRFRSGAAYPWDLQNNLTEALSIAHLLTDPADRQTLSEVTEVIAKDLEKVGNPLAAQKWRERVARILRPEEPINQLKLTLDKIIAAPSKMPQLKKEVEQAWEVFKKGVEAGHPIGPETKTSLLVATELLASEYIKLGDLKAATAVRMRVQTMPPAPPLGDLKARLAKEDPKLGLKLYPVDTTLFKNHALSIQRRTFGPGDTRLHLEAKLGHPARGQLQKSLDLIQANPNVLHGELPPGFCTGIKIEQQTTTYLGRAEKNGKKFAGDYSHAPDDGFKVQIALSDTAKDTLIHFEGVGSVKIGAQPPLFRTLYNRITIDLEPHITADEAVAKVMIMLSALGLEAAASSPRAEDEERIKILQLFHILYPRDAYKIERDEKTHERLP